jgi:hypothetical protein
MPATAASASLSCSGTIKKLPEPTKKPLCTLMQSGFLYSVVGRAGVEPTTNGLKVLNSVPLKATLSTFFSVAKKWCASFSIVATA